MDGPNSFGYQDGAMANPQAQRQDQTILPLFEFKKVFKKAEKDDDCQVRITFDEEVDETVEASLGFSTYLFIEQCLHERFKSAIDSAEIIATKINASTGNVRLKYTGEMIAKSKMKSEKMQVVQEILKETMTRLMQAEFRLPGLGVDLLLTVLGKSDMVFQKKASYHRSRKGVLFITCEENDVGKVTEEINKMLYTHFNILHFNKLAFDEIEPKLHEFHVSEGFVRTCTNGEWTLFMCGSKTFLSNVKSKIVTILSPTCKKYDIAGKALELLQKKKHAVNALLEHATKNGIHIALDLGEAVIFLGRMTTDKSCGLMAKAVISKTYKVSEQGMEILKDWVNEKLSHCSDTVSIRFESSCLIITGTQDSFRRTEESLMKRLAAKLDGQSFKLTQDSEEHLLKGFPKSHNTMPADFQPTSETPGTSITSVQSVKCKTGTHHEVPLKGKRLALFQTAPDADEYVRRIFSDKDWKIGFDFDKKTAVIECTNPEDVDSALKILNESIVERTWDFAGNEILPSNAEKLTTEKVPDERRKLICFSDDEKKSLTVTGTSDVIETVSRVIADLCGNPKITLACNGEENTVSLGKLKGTLNDLPDQSNNDKEGVVKKTVTCSKAIHSAICDSNYGFTEYLGSILSENGIRIRPTENTITCVALTRQALDKVEDLISKHVHEMSLSRSEPVWRVVSPEDFPRELTHPHIKVMLETESSPSVIVYTPDVATQVKKTIEDMRKSYQSIHYNISRKTLYQSVHELENELQRFCQVKVRVFEEKDELLIIWKDCEVDTVRDAIDVLLQNKKTEMDIKNGIKERKVQLSHNQFRLITHAEVHDYIEQKLKECHSIMSLDFESEEVTVHALTEEDAELGTRIIRSCFVETVLGQESYSEKDIMEVEGWLYEAFNRKAEIVPDGKDLRLISTDDVHDSLLSRFFDNKIYSELAVLKFIVKFRVAELQHLANINIEMISDENPHFELSGERDSLLDAKAKLKALCKSITSQRYDEYDENRVKLLKSEDGKRAISQIGNETQSVIELESIQNGEVEDSNCSDQEDGEEDSYPLGAEYHTSGNLHRKSKDGKSRIQIVDAYPLQFKGDVIAIPFTDDSMTPSLTRILKEGEVQDFWQEIHDQCIKSERQEIRSEQRNAVSFSPPGKLNCKQTAYFYIQTQKEQGKLKERIRNVIDCLIDKCIGKNMFTIGIYVSIQDDKLFTQIVKQILYYWHEKLKIQTVSKVTVFLMTDEERKSTLEDIWDKYKSGRGKVKNMLSGWKSSTKDKSKKTAGSPEAQNQSVYVVSGDLLEQNVDALVNSVDPKLDMSKGAISKALNNGTKDELQKAISKEHPKEIHAGDVKVIDLSVNELKCASIFNACLHDPNKKKDTRKVQDVVKKCLDEAKKKNYTSLAFPVLGTGKLGYQSKDVVPVMVDAVHSWFTSTKECPVKRVIFVVYKDDAVKRMFKKHLALKQYGSSAANDHEVNITYENVALHVIQSDFHHWRTTKVEEAMLCFWSNRYLSDPTQHPVIGNIVEAINFQESDVEKLRQGKPLKTTGGKLPVSSVIHILPKKQDLFGSLYRGLVKAGAEHYKNWHIAFPNGQARAKELADFMKALCQCLEAKDIREDQLSSITFWIPSQRIFERFVDLLRQETALRRGEMGPPKHQLVIAAASEENCETAQFKIKEWLCDKVSRQDTGMDMSSGSVSQPEEDNRTKMTEGDYSHVQQPDKNSSPVDAQSYAHNVAAGQISNIKVVLKGECEVNPEVLQNSSLWNDLKQKTESDFHLKIEKRDVKTFMIGDFNDLCNFVKYSHEFMSGKVQSETGSKSKDSQVYTDDCFSAMKHFFGEEILRKYFDIENVSPSSRRITFKQDTSTSGEAQKLSQAIKGLIQEEMVIQESDRDKAQAASKEAMKECKNVYVKYREENHVILMFAEDWAEMDKVKKLVKSHFGKSKTTRANRRFRTDHAISQDKPYPSGPPKSFIIQDGVALAEGKLLTIKVYKTDITTMSVDAIVNAANDQLSHGGGVARAIAAKAGSSLKHEGDRIVLTKGSIPVTGLVTTTAGNLPCKKVFHAVGPRWDDYLGKQDQCSEDLCRTVLRCLCEARKQGLASIAIPSISAAIFRVPEYLCARMYIRSLKSFDQAVDGGSLKEVHFVDVTDKMVNLIQAELQDKWKEPTDPDDLAQDTAFINRCLGSTTASASTNLTSYSKRNPSMPQEKMATDDSHSAPVTPVLPVEGCLDNVKITVIKGEIVDKSADVIVSWEDFSMPKPLVKLLIAKGGKEYKEKRDESITKKTLGPGLVLITDGYTLQQKHVIHVNATNITNQKDLEASLVNIFNCCHENNCASVLLPPYFGVQSGDQKKTFIEAVVQSWRRVLETDSKQLEVFVVDSSSQNVSRMSQILKEHLIALGLDASKGEDSEAKNECPVCMDVIQKPKKLKCGHSFCTKCIDRCFEDKQQCPVCKTICGVIKGTMPKGEMSVRDSWTHLPGFETFDTIVITYSFRDGRQSHHHPHPGQKYYGTFRTAYLPDTPEGRKVLALLKVAWERNLTFTIGPSVTYSDGVDRVTWNEIHHKTERYGGPERHGYPDPGYLTRVQEELEAVGITEKDLKTY